MGIIELLKSEIQKLFSTKAMLIPLVGLLLIPIVYAAILLSSKWGPYDYKDSLPVAVVNNDKGAISDGEDINVGNQLVETLKEGDGLGWEFVSNEEAQKGLDKNDYYMVIEIPEDFSQKVTTVLDDNPQVPEIRYIRNEGMNFLASQVTNSAAEKIREQLGDNITKTFANKVFNRFPDIAEGFLSGADGAKQIKDGTIQLSEGTETMLASLQEKAPDINRLAAGAQTAKAGANTLYSSVNGGTGSIKKLYDGANTLASKVAGGTSSIDALNNGANTLASKVSGGTKKIDELKGGANELYSKVSGGTEKIDELNAGANELATRVSEGTAGINQLDGGTASIADGIEKLNAGLNEFKTTVDGNTALADGITTINEMVNENLADMDSTQSKALESVIQTLGTDIVTASVAIKNVPDDYINSISEPSLRAALQTVKAKLSPLSETTMVDGEYKHNTAGNLKTTIDGVTQFKTKVRTGLTALAIATNGQPDGEFDKNGAEDLLLGANTYKSTISGTISKIMISTNGKPDGELDKQGTQDLLLGAKALDAGTTDLKTKWNALVVGTQKLSGGSDQLKESWTALEDGTGRLSEGSNTLKASWMELVGGTKQLSDGTNTLKGSWTALEDGTKQLSNGTSQLVGSWKKLSDGAGSLANGLDQIASGNQTVATGWKTLINGTTQLNDGAGKLRDGSDQLATGLEGGHEQVSAVKVTDDNVNMFASPVKLAGTDVNKYEFYRDSTAPYVLSLALFVTLLLSSFFIDFKKPAGTPGSAVSWFLSKWIMLAGLATAISLLVSLFVLLALKLSVANVGLFLLFGILTSITFMSIIFFFESMGQHVGRFLALAFIVLQLSTTGANLPIHMLPDNLQALGKFLPLTYSNTGFKAAISLGDSSMVWQNAIVLLGFLVVTSAIAFAIYAVNFKSVKSPQIDMDMQAEM